ncbi:efflux RND transporter periplasmic adaptor subunit [Roseovarius amoyensis]|uniref:efflux RND transporter periplasmic adaptor subunit n=1 Tax=Roseovarius amoyensis TaxID=2211448 RepID=UPI0013A6C2C6|nr:efflux transporter periplasmic adaptor subunit [Roseovarius amoyensis]
MKTARLLRIVPPVAIGIALSVWLVWQAEPPARVEQAERSVAARTLIAEAVPVRPVVRGYGTVSAAQSWQAVAEVAGAVTYRHPELETGNLIVAGTRVLEIDRSRYETALHQVQADLAALHAEGRQIDVEAENTARLLEIEKSRRTLAESDLARVRELVAQGAAPQARLDEQERATLQIRRGVQELENTLALVPVRKARLAAQAARAEAALASARRDLAMTRIETPFDLRVGEVHVERHQFVTAGQRLVTADGVARAEITVHLPVEGFPRLMGAAVSDSGVSFETGIRETVLDRIEAELRLVSGTGQVWQGRVIRVGNALDPQARSVPVVIAVDNPYAGIAPPLRLPLVPNMYVEAVLTGPELAPRITLPASAVHQGDTVYLRDADGRLALREVSLGWRQGDISVIEAGIEPGEEVIIDDIVPALPGTIVTPAESGE